MHSTNKNIIDEAVLSLRKRGAYLVSREKDLWLYLKEVKPNDYTRFSVVTDISHTHLSEDEIAMFSMSDTPRNENRDFYRSFWIEDDLANSVEEVLSNFDWLLGKSHQD